jgi:hypothetical protein
MRPLYYRLDPGSHWFGKMTGAGFFRVRVHCVCGWKTRPYWFHWLAANALINHQIDKAAPGVWYHGWYHGLFRGKRARRRGRGECDLSPAPSPQGLPVEPDERPA